MSSKDDVRPSPAPPVRKFPPGPRDPALSVEDWARNPEEFVPEPSIDEIERSPEIDPDEYLPDD